MKSSVVRDLVKQLHSAKSVEVPIEQVDYNVKETKSDGFSDYDAIIGIKEDSATIHVHERRRDAGNEKPLQMRTSTYGIVANISMRDESGAIIPADVRIVGSNMRGFPTKILVAKNGTLEKYEYLSSEAKMTPEDDIFKFSFGWDKWISLGGVGAIVYRSGHPTKLERFAYRAGNLFRKTAY